MKTAKTKQNLLLMDETAREILTMLFKVFSNLYNGLKSPYS